MITATIVVPGGAGVAPVATAVPVGSSGPSTVIVAGSPGSNTGAIGSGSGADSTGSGSSGSDSGSSGSGSSGSGSGTGSGDVCVCSTQTVVATGIYTVTVENIVDLGTTTYTTAYPTTTLGVISIAGGSVMPAVATVTNKAVVAANPSAALSPGQSYSTVVVPGSNGQPATTIVLIVTVITDVVEPVVAANGGGNNVAAVGTSVPAPFGNSTTTSMAMSASLDPSTATTLPSGGAQVGAAQTATQGQATVTTAQPTVTPTTAAGTTQAIAIAGTESTQVGTQGTTPLYNQPAFISAILDYHNQLRARHNAPAMTWNQDLANFALTNANANAADRTFEHTVTMGLTDPYGENIATQYGYNNPEYLVYKWYEEISSYSYANPGFSESTGHFTQLVWDASTQLGCAYVRANDANQNYLLTCEYSAPGNVDNEYAANVNEPVDTSTVAVPPTNI